MMRSRLVLAVYGAAALWLAVFVAYLVYLLLPFGVGLLSSLAAALVAVGLLAWLMRWLVWRPLRGQAASRWGFAAVLALAVGTLTFNAGWTHYLIPFLPRNQDDCSFGSISREAYQAIAREMEGQLAPNWARIVAQHENRAEALESQLVAELPTSASQEELIAQIHALARSIGAEYSLVFGSDNLTYQYKVDLNDVWSVRRFLFRWVVLQFTVAKTESDQKASLVSVYVHLPVFKGVRAATFPPEGRSCPPFPSDVQSASLRHATQLAWEKANASHLFVR